MSTPIAATANRCGWLRSAPFDLTLIVGVAALSLATGALVVARPHWFLAILILDLWLLGYHHVIATFTRLSFDTESFREHKFLVVVLPFIVFAGTIALGYTLGLWAIATTYLYWQWFHYTRQSYGIARIFSRKAGEPAADARLTTWALYLLPLWGILHRSYQRPDKFLDMDVRYLPTHAYVVYGVGAVAVAVLSFWVLRQLWAWRQGKLPVALTLYMVSHFVIFFVGYLLIEDITHGWLVINVWHNAQYILIVWIYNNNRFKDGIDRQHWLLSLLSQRRILNTIAYFSFCLLVTSMLYGAISLTLKLDFFAAIPLATIFVYQAINFHHYLVDGLIWKVRKKKMQKILGIEPEIRTS